MAEFDEIRDGLRRARADRETAGDGVFAAEERLQRIAAQQDALDRVFDPRNPEHRRESERLVRARADAEGRLRKHRAARDAARQAEAGLFASFAELSDPRRAIAQWEDRIPILLFPVRLETRFKAGELWVRIYPDTCSLDTFEAMLSEAELAHAKLYWAGIREAGGDEARERTAWRGLVAAHGEGRAAWIVRSTEPPKDAAAPPDDLDVQRHSWSRAPRTALLPDRFVFIGQAGDAPPLVVLGRPVPEPLVAGPDPAAPPDERLRQDENGEVVVPDEMRWMVDFDRAVEVGMAFRVPLGAAHAGGFDRILVVGLRLSASEAESQKDLATWIDHHRYGQTGFRLVPQGTPTNNTDAGGSGFDRADDADASFDDLRRDPLAHASADWLEKRDGQWLAEYLGLDPAVLGQVRHGDGRDQADARAMNVALWPATLGYWMETMMAPVFTPEAVERTRSFFHRFVLGRGAIPAVRIGNQPYGILPATALSRMQWLDRQDGPALRRLYAVLRLMDEDWKAMAGAVSFAGKPGDPFQTLLDIVGLCAGSVEHWQRYAESGEQLYNRLSLAGLSRFLTPAVFTRFQEAGAALLARFGVSERPDILNQYFFGRENRLGGPLVDDRPLSETAAVRAYTEDGKSYLQWLIDAARTSLSALYVQDGFQDGKLPQALLYLLLRHALQLGYHDAGVRLHESAGLLDAAAVRAARREEPFLHIREQAAASESRYRLLTRAEPAITGSAAVSVGDFIGSSLPSLPFYLNDQVAALEKLKDASTARLERAFTEHLDCCSYRLDAWLLGLVHARLAEMRGLRDGSEAPPRPGIYLGAYAWLEEVRPENKVLTPVRLDDPDLAAFFGKPGEPPLLRDSANQGYIHAPSLDQAVAAAVLRNGYLSNVSPENRQTLAVNLTSERVRTALALLDGVRAGQSLGALLGYRFERGLHDRHGLAEVDRLIFDLRRVFPLRADHLASTRPPEGVSIEAIEARNVIDGLALASHIRTTGLAAYPFGKSLPAVSAAEAEAVNAEALRLRDAHDAVADLALAEGVYQAVLGNYDRAAATYDTFGRATLPPEPQIVRTPPNGAGLTHRIGLHLAADADPDVSPIAGLAMTPRAQAEPALNEWLATVLPPLADIGCRVSFRRAADLLETDAPVTLRDLGLQPLDLLYLARRDHEPAMTELGDRIVRFIVASQAPRPDAPVRIDFMKKGPAPFSIFEILPLIGHLRRLALSSRPLRPTDLALSAEAASAEDAGVSVDPARLPLVQSAMQGARAQLDTFAAGLAPLLADLPARRGDIVANIDATVAGVVERLAAAARFSLPQAGWGFAYDFPRRVFLAVLAKTAERAAAWTARLEEFDALLAEHAALPGTATDAEKFALLVRAERLVATRTTSPLPASPDDFRNDLQTVRRAAFAAKLADLTAIEDTRRSTVAGLLADAQALLPITDFDLTELSFTAEEDEAIRFAEDAMSVVRTVLAEIDRRLAAAQALLAGDDAVQAAKALLGDDFVLIPGFGLPAGRGDEMEKALEASTSQTLFAHLAGTDFPVDTWLYGVARVRDAMRAWEQMVMLAGAFGRTEPELTPLQLPFRPDDRWLALELPPETKLDTERLLYTACYAAGFDKTRRQCGLLLDEWTEVIPASDAATGITFHYDRPDCEPPQTLLLVTPPVFRGAWQWDDLVAALNETLDFAKRRAVEPVHLDATPYARLLPATVLAATLGQLTISANLSLNNALLRELDED